MQGQRGPEHGRAAGDTGPVTLAAGRMELSWPVLGVWGEGRASAVSPGKPVEASGQVSSWRRSAQVHSARAGPEHQTCPAGKEGFWRGPRPRAGCQQLSVLKPVAGL